MHKKTILGHPSPVAQPNKPPSIPTRVETPGRGGARPAPPPSPSAKAPPPPSREPDLPPDDDDDFDEAPTAMFVHPVKYTYDPDAPPAQPGLLDDDDDDEDEPPTAIHVSPYRGDGAEEAPKPQPSPPPAPAPQPARPPQSAPQPSQGYQPPGVGQQAAPAQPDPRMFETQQLSAVQMAPASGQTGPGVATPPGDPMATYVDPDAAPVWLKALALSSVVSALTVLGVLGWMLSTRL